MEVVECTILPMPTKYLNDSLADGIRLPTSLGTIHSSVLAAGIRLATAAASRVGVAVLAAEAFSPPHLEVAALVAMASGVAAAVASPASHPLEAALGAWPRRQHR